MTAQIAIVAALARELHPLIKGWPKTVGVVVPDK